MHISLNLPQFIKRRTLFIVTDKEHAKFFIASQGVIEELVDLAIHPPVSESKLASGGWRKKIPRKGKLQGSPLGLEGLYRAFVKKVRAATLKLVQRQAFSQAYIFAPQHYHHELLDGLHPYVKKRIARVYPGDFIHDHPIELIRRAKELPE